VKWPNLSVLIVSMGLAVGCGRAPAVPTGQESYRRFCASCHGVEGHGDGPVGASLRRPPTDLTQIARRSGGRFDEREVMAAIDGRRLVAEHGPRDMPVWGQVFEQEHEEERYTRYTALLKSRTLVDYLRSIQE